MLLGIEDILYAVLEMAVSALTKCECYLPKQAHKHHPTPTVPLYTCT